MKTIYTLFMLALFVLPLASAVEQQTIDLGNFPTGSCVRLIQLCGNCTYNNITSVTYPSNGSAIVQNIGMTQFLTEYSYNFCDNSQNGQYLVNGFGDLDGVKTPWSYKYHIGGSLSLFLIICFAAVLILSIAFFMSNEYLGFVAGVMFCVAGVYLMINGLPDVANDFSRMMAIVLIALGFMFMMAVGYQIYSSAKEGDDE